MKMLTSSPFRCPGSRARRHFARRGGEGTISSGRQSVSFTHRNLGVGTKSVGSTQRNLGMVFGCPDVGFGNATCSIAC